MHIAEDMNSCLFFFFNATATTEIYTLSLHDALPIWAMQQYRPNFFYIYLPHLDYAADRKSTRLNSSHGYISYAVFCLKKKKKTDQYHNEEQTTHLATTHPPADGQKQQEQQPTQQDTI